MRQNIISGAGGIKRLPEQLTAMGGKRPLLVAGHSFQQLPVPQEISAILEKLPRFQDFQPNPDYDSVVKGVDLLRKENCDCVIAVGGGSAMDVAKGIKLYASMDPGKSYLEQIPEANDIGLLAIPTTAGTGSESTRYAVVYFRGEKQSLVHDSILPSGVILDPDLLDTLPVFQRKVTMLDALCHGIESFWSINSTEESKRHSKTALKLILDNLDGYLGNCSAGNAGMLLASNYAGRAINITQTTAGHAMCYKVTSLYHVPHGLAAFVCLPSLWEYMLSHLSACRDCRGEEYLASVFQELAGALGCAEPQKAIEKLRGLLAELSLSVPPLGAERNLEVLSKSVNPVRLKNNPVALDSEALKEIYRNIFCS